MPRLSYGHGERGGGAGTPSRFSDRRNSSHNSTSKLGETSGGLTPRAGIGRGGGELKTSFVDLGASASSSRAAIHPSSPEPRAPSGQAGGASPAGESVIAPRTPKFPPQRPPSRRDRGGDAGGGSTPTHTASVGCFPNLRQPGSIPNLPKGPRLSYTTMDNLGVDDSVVLGSEAGDILDGIALEGLESQEGPWCFPPAPHRLTDSPRDENGGGTTPTHDAIRARGISPTRLRNGIGVSSTGTSLGLSSGVNAAFRMSARNPKHRLHMRCLQNKKATYQTELDEYVDLFKEDHVDECDAIHDPSQIQALSPSMVVIHTLEGAIEVNVPRMTCLGCNKILCVPASTVQCHEGRPEQWYDQALLSTYRQLQAHSGITPEGFAQAVSLTNKSYYDAKRCVDAGNLSGFSSPRSDLDGLSMGGSQYGTNVRLPMPPMGSNVGAEAASTPPRRAVNPMCAGIQTSIETRGIGSSVRQYGRGCEGSYLPLSSQGSGLSGAGTGKIQLSPMVPTIKSVLDEATPKEKPSLVSRLKKTASNIVNGAPKAEAFACTLQAHMQADSSLASDEERSVDGSFTSSVSRLRPGQIELGGPKSPTIAAVILNMNSRGEDAERRKKKGIKARMKRAFSKQDSSQMPSPRHIAKGRGVQGCVPANSPVKACLQGAQ